MKSYDVIVIGTGGGMKIALPAAEMGLRVALVEKDAAGGTCLNRGCIPSKMLIHPADFMRRLEGARRIDLHPDGDLRVAFDDMVHRVSDTVDRMSQGLFAMLEASDNIDLYRGRAFFNGPRRVVVDTIEMTAPRIFVATGSVPRIPAVEGLAGTPFMTSREALRTTELPASMLVLGGGYIACELGHVFGTFGTKTTFLVRSRLLRPEDRELGDRFAAVFGRHHRILTGVLPQRVVYEGGRFHVLLRPAGEGREHTVTADSLLVAAGVVPATTDLELAATGVACDAGGFIRVDRHLRTSCEGVYAFGDCVGNHFFRHTVNREGEYLVDRFLKRAHREPLRYGPVPHAVFTWPEVAAVGRTEEALHADGIDYVAGYAEYSDSNQGLARQLDHGFVKLLVERKNGRLAGAHILGEDAATMVHMLIVLMARGGSLDDLLEVMFIHPALPELVRDAARDARARLRA